MLHSSIFTFNPLGTNCVVLWEDGQQACTVVDPGMSSPEGMEQLADVVARTGAFVEEIKALDGDVLISTHAIAMKGALEYLTPESHGSYWAKNIGNCDIYVSEVRDGKYTVPYCLDDGIDRWEGSDNK
jgi:broad specificity phosphatase PhoE